MIGNETHTAKAGDSIPIGILTVSDRAAQGIYEDKGGPGIAAVLQDFLLTPWHAVSRIVPDADPGAGFHGVPRPRAAEPGAWYPHRPHPTARARSCPSAVWIQERS